MTREEKNILNEHFIEWITFTEDRVDEWSKTAPQYIVDKLDYSPESLKYIEEFILSNFNKESLETLADKISIDAVISYYAETLRRNLPNSIWHLELEDVDSIDFNLPCIKTPIGTLINPYYLMKRVISKEKGTFLYDFYVKRLNFINNPHTY